jgi:hypothetical protein
MYAQQVRSTAGHALLVVAAVAAGIVGVLSLTNPRIALGYDFPDVGPSSTPLGAGLLIVPLAVVGIELYRLHSEIALRRAARQRTRSPQNSG